MDANDNRTQLDAHRAAIEAKLKLAQEHLNLASQLMKEVGNDSVTVANSAQEAGIAVSMEDAHAIREEAEDHSTIMGELGYGLGRMIGLVALFLGGAMVAKSVGEKNPYPRAR